MAVSCLFSRYCRLNFSGLNDVLSTSGGETVTLICGLDFQRGVPIRILRWPVAWDMQQTYRRSNTKLRLMSILCLRGHNNIPEAERKVAIVGCHSTVVSSLAYSYIDGQRPWSIVVDMAARRKPEKYCGLLSLYISSLLYCFEAC